MTSSATSVGPVLTTAAEDDFITVNNYLLVKNIVMA
jgi:hypothetical protein